jgi:hypothetical protein
VPNATDRDPSTYWATETYQSFTKSGVGVVVDAGRQVSLSRVAVETTDTPGFRAEIRTGASPSGPFDTRVSQPRVVNGKTRFAIDGASARYYLVWITEVPPEGVAHVAEVTARS